MKRYFTPDEANGLIPVLEHAFERIFYLQSALDEVAARLSDLPFEEMEVENHAVVADLTDRVNHELAQLNALGVVVESPEIGMVDFPSLHEGHEVLLCWRLGETEVLWWHRLDEGLNGRKGIGDKDRFNHK